LSKITDITTRRPEAWYAVRTRSNFEKNVSAELSGKGLDVFLPTFLEGRQWKDRKKVIELPLFPGYLFARIADTNEARLGILKATGVVQILGHGQSIEPVPDEQVQAVRTLLSANASCLTHPFLREGSRVRIRAGVLKGLEGFLVRLKNEFRLVISVELLCQSVAAEVDVQNVEPLTLMDQQRIA
jgi:transcription antitermination factor NusG